MELKRCSRGHYYDPSKHSGCPHCGVDGLEMEIGKTMPVYSSGMEKNKKVPSDKTVGIVKKETGIDPVVGWLVCIEGQNKGKDYRIKSEKNFIGRSEKMDICITGDESISREKHSVISYNPRKNNFVVYQGEGRGLVYLNDDEVIQPAELKAYDLIEIGQTKLLFIPLCGEVFKWDMANGG